MNTDAMTAVRVNSNVAGAKKSKQRDEKSIISSSTHKQVVKGAIVNINSIDYSPFTYFLK